MSLRIPKFAAVVGKFTLGFGDTAGDADADARRRGLWPEHREMCATVAIKGAHHFDKVLDRLPQPHCALHVYRYPDELGWPGCEDVKRATAKVGRARSQAGEDKAEERLRVELDVLDDHALQLWANVVIVDHRFCGATGQGGFWAKASGTSSRNPCASVKAGRSTAALCCDHRATIGEVVAMRKAVDANGEKR